MGRTNDPRENSKTGGKPNGEERVQERKVEVREQGGRRLKREKIIEEREDD